MPEPWSIEQMRSHLEQNWKTIQVNPNAADYNQETLRLYRVEMIFQHDLYDFFESVFFELRASPLLKEAMRTWLDLHQIGNTESKQAQFSHLKIVCKDKLTYQQILFALSQHGLRFKRLPQNTFPISTPRYSSNRSEPQPTKRDLEDWYSTQPESN